MSYLPNEIACGRSRPHSRPDIKATPSTNRIQPLTAMTTTTTITSPPAATHVPISRPRETAQRSSSQPVEINNLPQRPKTSFNPPINNFPGQADRICFDDPTPEQKEVKGRPSSDLYKRKHEILGNGINAYYPEWSLYNNGFFEGEIRKNDDGHSTNKYYRWDRSKNCDLEFINAGFRYADDDSASVTELQMDKDVTPVKVASVISESGDDNAKHPGTLKKFMNSVLSMNLSPRLIGESVIPTSVSLLSSAANLGERIYRAGVGVATAFFSEQEAVRDDYVTYNGYKIHTLGNNICIHSILLRGPKDQNLRVVVQTKDYDEFSTEVSSKNKCESRIFISDGKWTLIYGCFEEEGTGMVEISLPPGLSLTDISSEGTCNGLIFIDLP